MGESVKREMSREREREKETTRTACFARIVFCFAGAAVKGKSCALANNGYSLI